MSINVLKCILYLEIPSVRENNIIFLYNKKLVCYKDNPRIDLTLTNVLQDIFVLTPKKY